MVVRLSHATTLTEDMTWLSVGNYELTDNVQMTGKLRITGNVTLDLNDKTPTGNGSESVIRIESGGNLTLEDSIGSGTITRLQKMTGNGGGVYVASGGSLTMEGGNIVGCAATDDGGGIWIRLRIAARFTMVRS